MKTQIYQIISALAIAAYFIPMFIVLARKLAKEQSFLLFAIYWALGGLINLIDWIPGINANVLEKIGATYNMLDIPFILLILHYTTTSRLIKKGTFYCVATIVVMEIINAVINGINYAALKYMMAIGLLVVLFFITWEITRYLRKMHHCNRERSMIFIYAALLFEYGTYIIIYIFDYYITTTDAIDNFLIYYISSLIAIAIASYGFLMKEKTRKAIPVRSYWE